MITLQELYFAAREYLFPSGCSVCGTMLLDRRDAWYGLCRPCRERLAPDRGARCDRCGRPLISEIKTCLACRALPEDPTGLDRVLCLYPYVGDPKGLLRAYKFGKSLGAGHFLAEQALSALGTLRDMEHPVLVPVPPRPGKIKKQGWDQIEYLARILEKKHPLRRCLRRLPSRSQKELNRENRQKNLEGRILLRGEAPREVLLLDDVVTTGATLRACAAPLREAGARKVYALCLFYDV